MNKITSIVLIFLVSLQMVAQSESGIGRRWLVSCGADGSRLNLSPVYETEELVVLEDVKSGAFAIVVTDAYSSLVENRVLAYSTDNVFSNPESSWRNTLLSSYRSQLQMMKSEGIRSSSSGYVIGGGLLNNTVSPLLGKICWGQDFPFNLNCPLQPLVNGNKPAGCVAIAMSQVMRYHKYPVMGKGSHAYTYIDAIKKKDFSSYMISWDKIAPFYYSRVRLRGEDYTHVASLVEANAIAVSSQFAVLETSSNISNARTALVNFWNYSPECRFVTNRSATDVEQIIRNDLENHLPVILSGGGHAFVCDGCKGEYLHFNLGWYGAGNGYYRFLLNQSLSAKGIGKDVISSVVCGIKPKAIKDVSRIVFLTSPGMLSTLLPEKEAMSVTRLTLSGKMNGEDVRYLRRMLGADDILAFGKSKGVLQYLDISGVQIATDKIYPFARVSTKGCRYVSGSGSDDSKVYDFANMTHDQFTRFLKTNIAKGTGYRFVEVWDRFYVDLFTESRMISPCMFSGCQNLRTIVLPSSVNKVLALAFDGCSSLEEIVLHQGISEVEAGAFRNCYLLRRVITENSNLKEVRHGLSPFKTFGQYGVVTKARHNGILADNDTATCKGVFYSDKKNLIKLNSLEHKDYLK